MSTVTTRPNHYEVLGIASTASDAEIARAFAREMSPFKPRAFGGLAEVSVAYETLRDPARRRAYDVSIGIAAEPEPQPASMPEPDWKPFLIRAVARPAEPKAEPPRPPFIAAPPEPEPEPEPKPAKRDPRLDMFAALAAPAPLHRPVPEPAAEPAPAAAVDEHEPLPEIEDGSVDWKRAAAIGGGLVAAVGIFGAWAGWQASEGIEPEQAKAAVTVALPHSIPSQQARAAGSLGTSSMLDAPVANAPPSSQTRARTAQRTPAPQPPVASTDRLAEISQSLQSGAAEPAAPATEAAVVESTPPVATPAAMPLPKSVIARTIGRIGYACGQVASTAAVDGAPGVFTVTCTSGHSYQATPVRGRYHFRRVGGR